MCLIFSVADIISAFFFIYIALIFSFLLIITSILFKYYSYRAKYNRNLGELGRRTSFFKDLVPFNRLKTVINQLKNKSDSKTKYTDSNWYIKILKIDEIQQLYFDFLQSIYFQKELMNAFERKIDKKLVYKFVIIGGIFIPCLLADIVGIRYIFWSIFVIILLMMCSEILKILNFKRQSSKINAIYNNYYDLSQFNKKNWFIYEVLRLLQEYSVIMINIIPIPNEIYETNRERLNKEIEKIIEDLQ